MIRIVAELRKVRYLRQIVVALGRAAVAQYQNARSLFEHFAVPVTFISINSSRIQNLLGVLEGAGLSPGPDGKGRSCWLASGYVLASGMSEVIALHDCDILNYDRRLLARLCYPVANPNLDLEFSKGYYARVTNVMHRRVTRLFVTPLIRAMKAMASHAPFLEFLDGFRYPLAEEFAMRSRFARISRIPSDWGLEIGMLAEVHRNCARSRVCQVDLTDNYEHKHQNLSPEDPTKGLHRMATDVARSLFRSMAADVVMSLLPVNFAVCL